VWASNKIKLGKTSFLNDFHFVKETFCDRKMYQTQIQVINPVGNAKHFYYHCLTSLMMDAGGENLWLIVLREDRASIGANQTSDLASSLSPIDT
jgi:hypothetical protein